MNLYLTKKSVYDFYRIIEVSIISKSVHTVWISIMLASILNCAKHLQKIGVLSVYIHALPMSKFDHYYLSWVSLRLPSCKPSAAVCIVWEDILLLLTNHCLSSAYCLLCYCWVPTFWQGNHLNALSFTQWQCHRPLWRQPPWTEPVCLSYLFSQMHVFGKKS